MPVIDTTNLTKRYGTVTAVDGLDLSVEAGEVFGFLGPNGAGKSTTIDMLLDYTRPTAGSATILARDVQEHAAELRYDVGVLPEGFGLYDRLTGRRHLEFVADWQDTTVDTDQLLDRVGLDERDADRVVGEYSKGMAQRLALAIALVGDPDLLILDEPSAGLDPHGIQTMRRLVREAAADGTTVFFSSHILAEVEAVADRVAILADGELVAVDTVEDLRHTVGAGATLRLHVPGEVPGTVTDIDGVDSVTRTGTVLEVTTTDPTVKADVVTELTTAGVDIQDLTAEDPSLEDVFTAYTREVEP
ncbi:MAG: ATP-binding cassette domain-containing protein [Halobacteriaceae archaeon]